MPQRIDSLAFFASNSRTSIRLRVPYRNFIDIVTVLCYYAS
jgi:hypothetical protein